MLHRKVKRLVAWMQAGWRARQSRAVKGEKSMVQTQDMSLTALDQYRREVSRIPQLTDEEKTRLLQCIERRKLECSQQCFACAMCEAAQQARTRLVECYQHLVSRLT